MPPKRKYMPITLMTKKHRAMGIPVTMRTSKIPKMTTSQLCHSITILRGIRDLIQTCPGTSLLPVPFSIGSGFREL